MSDVMKSHKENRPSKLVRQENRYFFMFTGIAILGFLLFYIYPICRTFYLSLTDTKIATGSSEYIGFKNYVQARTKDKVPSAIH